MASLKDCLRNFGKASSGLAFPSAQRIVVRTLGASSTEEICEYTPPSGGYACIWVNGTSNTAAEIRDPDFVQQLATNPDSTWAKVFIPCTRGRKVIFSVWGAGIKQGEFYFVPSLGSQ